MSSSPVVRSVSAPGPAGATDLAAVDHHEGAITLIANAVNWNGTDERVDEAYDDAIARYRQGGTVRAVASLFRDRESLEAELLMERAGGRA